MFGFGSFASLVINGALCFVPSAIISKVARRGADVIIQVISLKKLFGAIGMKDFMIVLENGNQMIRIV